MLGSRRLGLKSENSHFSNALTWKFEERESCQWESRWRSRWRDALRFLWRDEQQLRTCSRFQLFQPPKVSAAFTAVHWTVFKVSNGDQVSWYSCYLRKSRVWDESNGKLPLEITKWAEESTIGVLFFGFEQVKTFWIKLFLWIIKPLEFSSNFVSKSCNGKRATEGGSALRTPQRVRPNIHQLDSRSLNSQFVTFKLFQVENFAHKVATYGCPSKVGTSKLEVRNSRGKGIKISLIKHLEQATNGMLRGKAARILDLFIDFWWVYKNSMNLLNV